MVRVVDVILWGRKIGALAFDGEKNIASFEYVSEFLGSKIEIAPIMMPLRSGIFQFSNLSVDTFARLPGCFADSLPDKFGNKLIDAWLEKNGRPKGSMNPLERLSYVGSRGMGALEYRPSMTDRELGSSESLEIESLLNVSRAVLSGREDLCVSMSEGQEEKALRELISVGTSAGGARAKAVIAYNEKTGEIRSGQTKCPEGFVHYLIKFDGLSNRDKEDEDPQFFSVMEYIYHKMAIGCGIEMAKCQLLEENQRRHFMTERFDRPNGQKLHMQSLCAMGHHDFNLARTTGYEQAFFIIDQLGLGMKVKEQFYRRVVFNVVARNQDDHTKNIAFLMDKKGKWSLAPAYDLCFSYNPQGAWTSSHQMTIGGKADGFSITDLMDLAARVKVGRKAASIIDEVRQSVSTWRALAEQEGLCESMIEEVARHQRLQLPA